MDIKGKTSLHVRTVSGAKNFITKSVESSEKYINKTAGVWQVLHFESLPKWLQDNDYLHYGHRPPLGSFKECFASIFRVHTETINIWTHLIGCVIFLCLASYFLIDSNLSWKDKAIFGCFFFGAILCLGLSSCYHTLSCHSPNIGKLFSKLDYCGIAFLITGSFIPWLYYGFYCEYEPKKWYIVIVTSLCLCAIIVSLWDRFSEPMFRPLRTFVFLVFGLSGIFPGLHWLFSNNRLSFDTLRASFFNLVLMGSLYVIGALLYACRIPERYFPGKFDYWFHSHQIFHILVIAAAFVHYRAISDLALFRVKAEICAEQMIK